MMPASPAQRAIAAFERVHGRQVTIHDRSGHLAGLIDPAHLTHRHPACTAAKVADAGRCVAFDVQRMARDLPALPEGRIQRCWAGVVEWVVPIVVGADPVAVLFAGSGRAHGPGLAVDDAPAAARASPRIDEEEAALVLECLRQLAARLARLLEGRGEQRGKARPLSDPIPDPRARRHQAILAFVERNYLRELAVADLARALGLSAGRTIHAVRECCGRSFVALLRDKRLDAAAAALRHSELDVLSVATRSGFGDISHFHRCFKRRFGLTPLRYRMRNGA